MMKEGFIMRKLLALLLAALMLCTLIACDNGGTSSDPVSSEVVSENESEVLSAPESTPELTTTSGRSRTTTTTTGKTEKTTKPAFEFNTANEKPVTEDISIRYNEMHSESDAQAAAMKKKVLEAKDEVGPATNGTTYYVSYKGNDKNDGTSPAKAWRTTQRVYEAQSQFKSGDVVLFERGGVYRGTMRYVSGMKIGAYGTGSKPQLLAGPRDVADPSLWKQTKYENVWEINVSGLKDIGNIVFNHGEVCASTTRMFEKHLVTDVKKSQDFYYYHNAAKGYLYMYYSKGNPGAAFDSIELCPGSTIITKADGGKREVKDVVIDNLCLRYSGTFGVTAPNCTNITVTNCEIGYIGGSLQNPRVRYGNGIEFNGEVHGVEVRNNWIYQCYDAGYTHQCGGVEENVHVDANLIEYCNYNIEYFLQAPGNMHNMIIENNILRFAGYGFGTKNRFGSSDEYVGNISGNKKPEDCKGAYVRNNIIDTSFNQLVMEAYQDGVNGPIYEGNTWIQWNDTKSAAFNPFDKSKTGTSPAETKLSCANQKAFEESIAKVDKKATVIFYECKK